MRVQGCKKVQDRRCSLESWVFMKILKIGRDAPVLVVIPPAWNDPGESMDCLVRGS